MADKLTCLVTIHGIGFQQAPDGDIPGYADGLQDSLLRALPTTLGGDPASEFGRPAGTGAIYVHSDWPPDTRKANEGLARLGSWAAGDASHRTVDTSNAPLADGDKPIAHVALIYSHLEDQGPHLGAALQTLADAVVAHTHYESLPGIVGMGLKDAWALLHHPDQIAKAAPSLEVRRPRAAAPGGQEKQKDGGSGPLSVIAQLDQDVSTYICRNDLRERVRSFAHDAILRLCCREDVDSVVINAHSQGTVLAYDVLRTLPPFAAQKVKLLVTAGSPLRKYATLFYWGTDAGCLYQIPWINFWDQTDPVADPLAPPLAWRRNQPLPGPTGISGLFTATDPDTGNPLPIHLFDLETQNEAHGAGGGLPAHNYWDNDEQVVQPLAKLLQEVTAGQPASLTPV